jgi:uncharacterized protein (TIGR03437 family)
VDGDGDVFISDTGNNLIRQVTPNGTIYTIAGNATAGFSGDGGLAVAAQISAPAGIVIDGSGALYFADSGNNRVRRLTPQAVLPPAAVTTLQQVSVVSAASLLGGAIAPGEIVTIYGSGIGPLQGVPGTMNASGLLSNLAGGSEIHFDGVAAPIFYAQAGQVNAQAPYTIAGQSSTHVEVFCQGQPVGEADVPVAPAAPAVFPTVLNPDGSLNSASNAAMQGSILTFFATGEGLTDGANVTGQPTSAPYPQPMMPVTIIIGGVPATVLYAGDAPGLVGMLQVNTIVPAGTASGGVNAVLTVGATSAPAVSVWIQ